MSDFGYPVDDTSASIVGDTPNGVQHGYDSDISSGGDGELPTSPNSSDLYNVLESAIRTQMDALAVSGSGSSPNLHPQSQRGHGGDSQQSRNGDNDADDDGLDSELSRLGDAERTMREELAAAVMEFGRSFPTASTAADTDGICNAGNASASSSVPVQEESITDTVTAFSGNSNDTCNNDSQENAVSATAGNSIDVRAQQHDHQHEQHGWQQENERPRRGKSEAELIDERELNSALEALCQWIRQDDSLLFGESDTGRLRRKQRQEQMRQQRPRLPGETPPPTATRLSTRPSRMGFVATGSSSSRNRDERRPPTKSQRNSQRASSNAAMGACSDGYQPTTVRAQLKDLEQRIPINELSKWLSESSGRQFDKSRQKAIPHRTGSSTDSSGAIGRHVQQQEQDDEDTPSTFHLHSGGSSSLIVLGAMGNIIKAPKGRSPLRKNLR